MENRRKIRVILMEMFLRHLKDGSEIPQGFLYNGTQYKVTVARLETDPGGYCYATPINDDGTFMKGSEEVAIAIEGFTIN